MEVGIILPMLALIMFYGVIYMQASQKPKKDKPCSPDCKGCGNNCGCKKHKPLKPVKA